MLLRFVLLPRYEAFFSFAALFSFLEFYVCSFRRILHLCLFSFVSLSSSFSHVDQDDWNTHGANTSYDFFRSRTLTSAPVRCSSALVRCTSAPLRWTRVPVRWSSAPVRCTSASLEHQCGALVHRCSALVHHTGALVHRYTFSALKSAPKYQSRCTGALVYRTGASSVQDDCVGLGVVLDMLYFCGLRDSHEKV